MRTKIAALALSLAGLALTVPAQANKGQMKKSQVQGTILRQKEVSLPDGSTRHKVVLLKSEDGRQIAVDLGPTEKLKEISLSSGTELKVTGKLVRIGDRPVLFANKINMGGSSFDVERSDLHKPGMMKEPAGSEGTTPGGEASGLTGDQAGSLQLGQGPQKISGRISRLKDVKLQSPKPGEAGQTGAGSQEGMESDLETGSTEKSLSASSKMGTVKHTVALLNTTDGQNVIVDLGPSKKLKTLKLRSGQRISVQVRPIRIGDRLVLLADRLTARGKTVRITQTKPMSAQRPLDDSSPDVSPDTDTSVPGETLPEESPGGTTSPDDTSTPGGTTSPDDTSAPGGTTSPDDTSAPGGTTSPDDSTSPGGAGSPPGSEGRNPGM